MKLLLFSLVILLAGCGAEKPVKAKVPQAPAGYAYDGYCIPDGLNAKTGRYDFVSCVHKDGSKDVYKRVSQ